MFSDPLMWVRPTATVTCSLVGRCIWPGSSRVCRVLPGLTCLVRTSQSNMRFPTTLTPWTQTGTADIRRLSGRKRFVQLSLWNKIFPLTKLKLTIFKSGMIKLVKVLYFSLNIFVCFWLYLRGSIRDQSHLARLAMRAWEKHVWYSRGWP